MNDDRDPLETLREELDVTPSASFEMRVRERVQDERRSPWLVSGRLIGSAAVAALAGCVAVWGITTGRVGRPAPADAPGPTTQSSTQVIASSPSGPEPGATALPEVEARAPKSMLVPPRDTRAERRAANANADSVRRDPAAVFRPFEDVVISPSEQRGLLLLMRYGDADTLPPSPGPLAVDEPVSVVALNKLPPIYIFPVDADVRTGPVSDSSR